jgi:hypothetical protein
MGSANQLPMVGRGSRADEQLEQGVTKSQTDSQVTAIP